MTLIAFYVTYLPLPLVLLTSRDLSQHVHIAPEAFKVASNEFGDEISFWQEALPGKLKGHLASVSQTRSLIFLHLGIHTSVSLAFGCQSAFDQRGRTVRRG